MIPLQSQNWHKQTFSPFPFPLFPRVFTLETLTYSQIIGERLRKGTTLDKCVTFPQYSLWRISSDVVNDFEYSFSLFIQRFSKGCERPKRHTVLSLLYICKEWYLAENDLLWLIEQRSPWSRFDRGFQRMFWDECGLQICRNDSAKGSFFCAALLRHLDRHLSRGGSPLGRSIAKME